MFTNKFMNIMCTVKNSSLLQFVMFSGYCSCHFFILVLWVAYVFVSCVDCISIWICRISEWLAGFNFVIFSYFLVSFDVAVETVMQMCKVQQPMSVLVQNVMCACNSVFRAWTIHCVFCFSFSQWWINITWCRLG